MNRITLLLVILVLFLGGSVALAQSGGGFDLVRSVTEGGGGPSTGGAFTLSGTAGQDEAGSAMAGGGITLTGGYWAGVPAASTPTATSTATATGAATATATATATSTPTATATGVATATATATATGAQHKLYLPVATQGKNE